MIEMKQLCFYLIYCILKGGIKGLKNPGGKSGRAKVYCLTRLDLNPGMDLGLLQFRIAVNLLALGVRIFSTNV